MGEPSAREPWGFQLDGHHLNLNYVVLGDQVVMTPAFWGSEPTIATSGKYAGTSILQDEQGRGLQMIRALTPEQRTQAVVNTSKTATTSVAGVQRQRRSGLCRRARSSLSPAQKKQLLDLVGLYVGNLREGHARVHMADVERHLDSTYSRGLENEMGRSITTEFTAR